jgi:hypothetical protein
MATPRAALENALASRACSFLAGVTSTTVPFTRPARKASAGSDPALHHTELFARAGASSAAGRHGWPPAAARGRLRSSGGEPRYDSNVSGRRPRQARPPRRLRPADGSRGDFHSQAPMRAARGLAGLRCGAARPPREAVGHVPSDDRERGPGLKLSAAREGRRSPLLSGRDLRVLSTKRGLSARPRAAASSTGLAHGGVADGFPHVVPVIRPKPS